MSRLSAETQTDSTFYQTIVSHYPVAWEALQQIGSMGGKTVSYTAIQSSPFELEGVDSSLAAKRTTTADIVVQDGITDTFDPALLGILREVACCKLPFFYTQSFKSLSRRYDKLLRVMEFVLTHGAPFVTNNYYIGNGYIEKRPKLIRAPHGIPNEISDFVSYPGAGKNHNAVLLAIIHSMEHDERLQHR